MRLAYLVLAVAGVAAVLVTSGAAMWRSWQDLQAEHERYRFDGDRYVLDAAAAAPDLAGLGPLLVAADAAQVGRLSPPFLVYVSGRTEPLVVVEVDRTFLKAHSPEEGLVLYRRRALPRLVVPAPEARP